jgi:hypothetical protein
MYLQKVISRKNCVKNKFFDGILKVKDDSRIRIQDPDPDPLVRGMDPRIRIRIHPKMSWIRNTSTYFKDCSDSRIRIPVPAFLLSVLMSSPAFGNIFRVH